VTFPVDRVDERTFDPGWSGDLVVCDIDRTYLNTRFSSLKGLSRIPLEFAVDKRDIAGMAVLLKELRRGPNPTSRQTPLYFVSASPPQMRAVIERKMLMDGVEYDGTTFKDWKRCIRSGRLGRLKEQVGFKLTALMHGRTEWPRNVREVLLGDDLEKDALAYCLYADVVAGRIPLDEVPQVLTGVGVARPDAWGVRDLKQRVPDHATVGRICIRLEKNDPVAFAEFLPHVAPCRGTLQMALVLLADGLLSGRGLRRVAEDLVRHGRQPEQLAEALGDAAARHLLDAESAREIGREWFDRGTLEHPAQIPTPGPATEAAPGSLWTPSRYLPG
jgi:hypothetical protein